MLFIPSLSLLPSEASAQPRPDFWDCLTTQETLPPIHGDQQDASQEREEITCYQALSSRACRECGNTIWLQDPPASTDLCSLCLLSSHDAPSCPPPRPDDSDALGDSWLLPSPPPDKDAKDCKRAWGVEERRTHREACMGKKRLTLDEKAEIIRLYYRAGQEESPVKQMTIAETYGKSRAAISKLLRPENAHRVMVRFAEKAAKAAKAGGAEKGGRGRKKRKTEEGKEGEGSTRDSLSGMHGMEHQGSRGEGQSNAGTGGCFLKTAA